jgi:sugar lactone lactonase YvrE
MRQRLTILVGLAMVSALVIPSAAPAQAAGGVLHLRPVANFPIQGGIGAFAESMAIDGQGNLYASVTDWAPDFTDNAGQVWKISRSGALSRFGAQVETGILTGLAFDGYGRLYVGVVPFDPIAGAPGVVRIESSGTVTRVLTLPADAFPNGLAFRGCDLYVSDSATGAIWRIRPGTANQSPIAPWFQDAALAPVTGLGVNGIAFWSDSLFAVNADTGTVIRIPVGRNGSAGGPVVVASNPSLVTADGLAFDVTGRLWITVNKDVGGALVQVTQDGSTRVVVDSRHWLDYPTQPVFGTSGSDGTTLFVANGSWNIGAPNVVGLDAGVRGLPLP